jgi:predicted GH43/DUF377 family glycosyl hydrolase
MRLKQPLFTRYANNPVLVPEQWQHTVNAVFNAGVTSFQEETLLLVRVEERSGLSYLSVARSADGYTNWRIDPDQVMLPEAGSYEEAWGIEDARITKCGEEFMIVYTGYSYGGPLVRLAATRDFCSFERRGTLMTPDDKDAALFPCVFDGRWALLHRPSATADAAGQRGAHIWLSWSPDLRHWGDPTVLLRARQGGWWDANKIGLGPPPMLTAYGWLVLFHGVRATVSGAIYRLGLALLDRDDPATVLVRGNEWIFGPEEDYERSGDVPDVVFPCGWLLEDDERTIRMYYGAADSRICVATADLEQVIAYLHRHCICGNLHERGERCPVAAMQAFSFAP